MPASPAADIHGNNLFLLSCRAVPAPGSGHCFTSTAPLLVLGPPPRTGAAAEKFIVVWYSSVTYRP